MPLIASVLRANDIGTAQFNPVRFDVPLPDGGRVYMRLSHRVIGHERFATVEIADISVADQGQGTARTVFREAEDYARETGRVVFVENVYNPILILALLRWGYRPRKQLEGDPVDYWKQTK